MGEENKNRKATEIVNLELFKNQIDESAAKAKHFFCIAFEEETTPDGKTKPVALEPIILGNPNIFYVSAVAANMKAEFMRQIEQSNINMCAPLPKNQGA